MQGREVVSARPPNIPSHPAPFPSLCPPIPHPALPHSLDSAPNTPSRPAPFPPRLCHPSTPHPAHPIPCNASWLGFRPNPTGAPASKDRRKWPTLQPAFLWDEDTLLAAQGPMGGQGSITHEGAESTPREEFFPLQDLTGLGARGLDPEVPFHSMPPNPISFTD